MVLMGDGHLRCAHVLEVLRPIVTRIGQANTIQSFEQHFDYVLENRGTRPISELLLLHQRSLAPKPTNLLGADDSRQVTCTAIDQADTSLGDTPFRTKPQPNGSGKIRMWLRVAGGNPSGVFVNEPEPLDLTPVRLRSAEFTTLGLSPGAYARYRASPTAETPVILRLDPALQPFDPDNPSETRYLLRLHFAELRVDPVCAEPLVSGSAERDLSLIKQTFETWSPEFLRQRAVHRLRTIRDDGEDPAIREGAQTLLDRWLLNPDRTVHTDDHRIAVVTSPRCMLADHVIRGGLTFWQRRQQIHENNAGRPAADQPLRWLNIWTSGPAWNTCLDPAAVAHKVLEVLKTFRGPDRERGNWYRVDVLLPVISTKLGTEIGWDNLVALLKVLLEVRLFQPDGTGSLAACPPLLEHREGQKWRLHQFWSEVTRQLPEVEDLRVPVRCKLIETQAAHTSVACPFDERPFILLFGIYLVS